MFRPFKLNEIGRNQKKVHGEVRDIPNNGKNRSLNNGIVNTFTESEKALKSSFKNGLLMKIGCQELLLWWTSFLKGGSYKAGCF